MSGRRPDVTRRSGLGLLRLAIGRADGFACFGNNADAYLASLAPLVALLLVLSGLAAAEGSPRRGATTFLLSVCQLLAPPVIADYLCRRWDRQDRWALYANILNWAQFLFFTLLTVLMALASAGVAAGVPAPVVSILAMLVFIAYLGWFHWFVARGALAISRRRTALLLGATVLFTFGLALILALFGDGVGQFKVDMV